MEPVVAVLFVVGLVLLVAGGEALVRGAAGLASAAGISPIVIGLTVVAFGTSSPELAVSIGSAFTGETDIVVGNIVGSNIYNVLLILGLSAVIMPLTVGRQLVRRDVPLMVLASLGVLLFALDGSIGRLDGLILVAGLVTWTAWSVIAARAETPAESRKAEEEIRSLSSSSRLRQVGLILLGLVMLVIGARWLVDGAVAVATAVGLPPLVIGLTVVAVGTSLPELATSVIATIRGQRDLAVGNIVGSNLFNLLGVLGFTAVIAGDVPVPPGALSFDLPVMVAVAIACLPIFFTGYRIGRAEGALFLAYAVGYTVYLLATAVEHAEVTALTEALAFVLLPLTALTLLILAVRQWRAHRGMTAG
ncbi:MAG TPA: calcium/sodium antiporter [Candidatus Limnocylindrales bacterium]|nr:calcium/sodium antiporter [Candidatus Limnocylindrales bacterium]